MDKKTKDIYRIDATNQILGRLATKIATILMEKNKPFYVPYKKQSKLIIVKNVKKIKISGKKLSKKVYYRHTGYPGKLKKIKISEIFKKKPEKILKNTILGMLPKNKLRAKMIKQVKFE